MVAVSLMGMSVKSREGTLMVQTPLSAIAPIQRLGHRLRCLWEVSTRLGFYAAAHGMLGKISRPGEKCLALRYRLTSLVDRALVDILVQDGQGVHTEISLFKVATHDAAIKAMDGALYQIEHGRLVAESLRLVTHVCSAGDVSCASWT